MWVLLAGCNTSMSGAAVVAVVIGDCSVLISVAVQTFSTATSGMYSDSEWRAGISIEVVLAHLALPDMG